MFKDTQFSCESQALESIEAVITLTFFSLQLLALFLILTSPQEREERHGKEQRVNHVLIEDLIIICVCIILLNNFPLNVVLFKLKKTVITGLPIIIYYHFQ